MKTKKLSILALAFLAFASCKKDGDNEQDDMKNKIILNGEVFDVIETRNKLGKLLRIDQNELSYVPDSIAFSREGYSGLFYVDFYISNLKQIKL